MIRDYGKAHDLTSAQDVATMLNQPGKQPKPDAWASFRTAIVLPPINHNYEEVSPIPGIKNFSCFVPYAENRTMMRKLPCGQPCCLSMDASQMMNCESRAMAGWFDDHSEGSGKAVVHFRIPPKKNKKEKSPSS